MGFRNSGVRVLLLFVIGVLAWYTFSLYHELYKNYTVNQLSVASTTPADKAAQQSSQVDQQQDEKVRESQQKPKVFKDHETNTPEKVSEISESQKKSEKVDSPLEKVDDPDNLINKDILKKAEEEWNANKMVPDASSRTPCSSTKCPANEFNFKIISGAANVIGPSICFNDTILMKNSLNNVDRGMNIARVNGINGKLEKWAVFDLYSKDSTELKAFVKDLGDQDIVLVSSYDDSASRLDDEARSLLEQLGSKKSKSLSFRDNWIFVGGKTLEKPYEGYIANNREINKYGDWPGAITIEGCVPAFPANS